MSANPYDQLHDLIETKGMTATEAADEVLARPPADWEVFKAAIRPYIISQAKHIESRLFNRQLKHTLPLGGKPPSRMLSFRATPEAPAVPRRMRYKMPDGQVVFFDEMTVEFINIKITHLRQQMGGLSDHITRLRSARDLLVETGKHDLSEIPDWQDRIQERLSHNPEWNAVSEPEKTARIGECPPEHPVGCTCHASAGVV